MAELKASEVKYSTPLVTKLGPFLFTATEIEFPASAEAVTGGVELNLKKLGLTDEGVFGTHQVAGPKAEALEVASTTVLPFAAWTTPLLAQKEAAESAKLIAKANVTAISVNAEKLFLRILAVKAAKEPMQESSTAEKGETGAVGLCGCTVFCIGK
jgi:hypothetical protein